RKARACFARIATVSAGRADPFARRKRNSINCVRHGRYYSLQAQGDFRGIALREEAHVGLIDGRHGDRRQDVALVLRHGDDLLAFLVFVPREPDTIPPFLATVFVPSPWRIRRSRCFSAARCRTLATNARHSDPSSAHFAKTL